MKKEINKHIVNPIELNGKLLRIQVAKDTICCEQEKQAISYYTVMGQDIETGKVYVLFEQLDEGES
jgi:hypothetical protein